MSPYLFGLQITWTITVIRLELIGNDTRDFGECSGGFYTPVLSIRACGCGQTADETANERADSHHWQCSEGG